MGLFPKEAVSEGAALGGAPRRMAWTRERGTLKLLLLFAALLVAWYVYGQVSDHILLSKVWPPLSPDPTGLTVVGTLDARDSLDRNLFRIVEANKTYRAEITDFGWRSYMFTGMGNSLFSENAGNAIRTALGIDDAAGYAMLTPYLRVAIARLMGQPRPESLISKDTPVRYQEQMVKGAQQKETTLGALLQRFHGGRDSQNDNGDQSDVQEGGGGGGHDIDHGLPISAVTLRDSCPVVLTGAQFSGASLDEQPETLLQGKTWTAHLYLTPEGRSRFYQWSHDHANEHLCFILGDQMVAAGRIRQTLDVNEWELGPLRDGDAAKALVDYVEKENHKTP
ncbi:MAG TPA: hypothetical protein VKT32_17735 [Chthonomonadaceae bacterium]|nr:hypothetical protein [Chthonomonadaceae bacterium]